MLTPRDIYPTRSLDKNALIQAPSRETFARLLSQGWTDALRTLHPEGLLWTIWDYERDRWACGQSHAPRSFAAFAVTARPSLDAGVDRDVRGQENASGHAPAWIVLDL